jgi:hypothetical protein
MDATFTFSLVDLLTLLSLATLGTIVVWWVMNRVSSLRH